METANNVPQVYGAIAAVMGALSKEGIAKLERNKEQGYQFRGIDSIYSALSAKLVEHGLLMLPRVVKREHYEKVTKSGAVLLYARLEMEYDMVAVADGSKHVISTYGEAMDSGDKSGNKAMSAAYKYAAIQAFCIPTVGEPDADLDSPEGLAPPEGHQPPPQQQQQPQRAPRQQRATPRQAQEAAAQQQQNAQRRQQGATQAEVDALIMVLREAAKGGEVQFNRSWEINAGPARKVIFADQKLMAELKQACTEADLAEGNITR